MEFRARADEQRVGFLDAGSESEGLRFHPIKRALPCVAEDARGRLGAQEYGVQKLLRGLRATTHRQRIKRMAGHNRAAGGVQLLRPAPMELDRDAPVRKWRRIARYDQARFPYRR